MAAKTYTLRQHRLACFIVFGVQGFAFSLLVSRVPALQKQLHLSDGTLSILLAVVPIVAGAGSVLAGVATKWFSSSVLLRIAQPVVMLSLLVAPHTKTLGQAMPVLAVFGLAVGAVDATMNMQAVGLQRRYGRSIILGFHSVWAAGAIAASAYCAIGASIHWSLAAVYTIGIPPAVVLSLVAGPLLLKGLGDESIVKTDEGKAPALPWRPIALLCVVMTLTYICDSTVNTAGGVFQTKGLHSKDWQSAAVVGVYTAGLLLGRFRGDTLVRRYGGVLIVRVGAVIASLGFLITIAAANPYMALAGFFVTGVGLSVIVPQAFAAADRSDPAGTGVQIARINVFNYVGFLLGSPLVTTVWGAGVSYRAGLVIPLVLIIVVVVLAHAFDENRTTLPAGTGGAGGAGGGTPVAGGAEAVPTLGT